MEHVVFFPGLDGNPAFRRLASRDDALRFVEHLRNVEGVSEVSVHGLSPVPLAFRTYYTVEVPAEPGVAPAAMGVPVEPVVPVERVDGELVDASAGVGDGSANGRAAVGFFAH
jgi:hypothetical protein